MPGGRRTWEGKCEKTENQIPGANTHFLSGLGNSIKTWNGVPVALEGTAGF